MKRMPRHKTDKEVAQFWETHSFEDYYKDTKDADIKFIKKPKKAITIRFAPIDIKLIEAIAEQKGLNYTTLIRMWVKEHLARESKHVA